jgi:hypothetical protein
MFKSNRVTCVIVDKKPNIFCNWSCEYPSINYEFINENFVCVESTCLQNITAVFSWISGIESNLLRSSFMLKLYSISVLNGHRTCFFLTAMSKADSLTEAFMSCRRSKMFSSFLLRSGTKAWKTRKNILLVNELI